MTTIRKATLGLITVLSAMAFMAQAHAAPIVNLVPGGGIASINVNLSVNDTTITIEENWTSTDPAFLEISGFFDEVDYTIIKIITNNTGVSWTSFTNELLDPFDSTGADTSQDDLDPRPFPGFVPAGFSTSNDQDGLSFAQNAGLPRTSSIFPDLVVDELTDVRDFLDFFGGMLPDGGVDNFMTFGIRDNNGVGDADCTGADNELPCPNQPFLLSQRPNAFSDSLPVPEPMTLGLFGVGLAALGFMMRRRRWKAIA